MDKDVKRSKIEEELLERKIWRVEEVRMGEEEEEMN